MNTIKLIASRKGVFYSALAGVVLVAGGTAIYRGIAASSPESTIRQGLVGYWKFNEGSGTVTADSSGNNYDGILKNGVTWVAPSGCVKGACVSLDGAHYIDGVHYPSGYITMGTTTALALAGPMSATAWFNCTVPDCATYTYMGIVGNGTTGSLLNYFLATGYPKWKVALWNTGAGPDVYSASDVGTGWHHVAATRSGTPGNWEMKLYFDGVLQMTTTTARDPWNPADAETAVGRAGGYGDFTYFGGLIDEVRLYDRPLTDAEVATIYEHTAP